MQKLFTVHAHICEWGRREKIWEEKKERNKKKNVISRTLTDGVKDAVVRKKRREENWKKDYTYVQCRILENQEKRKLCCKLQNIIFSSCCPSLTLLRFVVFFSCFKNEIVLFFKVKYTYKRAKLILSVAFIHMKLSFSFGSVSNQASKVSING